MKVYLALAIALIVPALAFGHFNMMGGGDWGHPMGYFGMGGGLMMVIFYVVVFMLLYSIVKGVLGNRKQMNANAIQILKERFARGELSHTEYQEMKKQL